MALSFAESDITLDCQETIAKLKLIGLLQKDEKINAREVSVQPNNFFTGFYRRFIMPDDRTKTLALLRDVFQHTYDAISLFISKRSFVLAKNIIRDLQKAKQGLVNLKYTYDSDRKFCCDIDLLIESIDLKLDNLKDNHTNLFESLTPSPGRSPALSSTPAPNINNFGDSDTASTLSKD